MKYKVLKSFTLFGVKYKKGDIISTEKDSYDVYFQEDADALIANMNEGYLEGIYKKCKKAELLPYREYTYGVYISVRFDEDIKVINTKTKEEEIFKKGQEEFLKENTTNERFQLLTKISNTEKNEYGFEGYATFKYGKYQASGKAFKTKGVSHYKIIKLCSETT